MFSDAMVYHKGMVRIFENTVGYVVCYVCIQFVWFLTLQIIQINYMLFDE